MTDQDPTEPSVRESRLILAALLVTHEHDDTDGAALLLNQLTIEEATGALQSAAWAVHSLLAERPGGLNRWLRTRRRVEEVMLTTRDLPESDIDGGG